MWLAEDLFKGRAWGFFSVGLGKKPILFSGIFVAVHSHKWIEIKKHFNYFASNIYVPVLRHQNILRVLRGSLNN